MSKYVFCVERCSTQKPLIIDKIDCYLIDKNIIYTHCINCIDSYQFKDIDWCPIIARGCFIEKHIYDINTNLYDFETFLQENNISYNRVDE